MGKIVDFIDGLLSVFAADTNLMNDPNVWQPMGGLFGASGYGNYSTTSGEVVSERTALLVSTHFSCIRCKSEDLAWIPVTIAERVDNDERVIRDDHPVHRILNVEFNREMNAMRGKSLLFAHEFGFRKGVAEIERNRNGDPVALWPMDPSLVQKKRIAGRIVHEYRQPGGGLVTLPDADVFELIGPSYDGQIGYSLAEITKYALGTLLAAQKFQGSFFGNGAFLGGVIEKLPGGMSAEQIDSLRKQFNERHQGSGRAFNTAIIPKGEFKEIGINPRQAQLDQLQQYSSLDVCRVHRVPPPKVQDLKEAHYNNVEHLQIAYVRDALMPPGRDFELEVQRKLLSGNLYCRLNYNARMRADQESRMRAYSLGRMWGLYSINEIRRLEDENPIEGPEGDMRLIPANMIPIEMAYRQRDQIATNAAPPKQTQDQAAFRESFLPLILDGLQRAAAKESKVMASKKALGADRLNRFHDEQKAYLGELVSPALRSMAALMGGEIADADMEVINGKFGAAYFDDRPLLAGPKSEAFEPFLNDLAEKWIDAAHTAATKGAHSPC
jgi:HK97 family phage portal protein